MSPRSQGFGHPFDDKSDLDGGSEQELAIRKTVQIDVTSSRKGYPGPVAFGTRRGSVERYSPRSAERTISFDGIGSTDASKSSVYNNRVTV